MLWRLLFYQQGRESGQSRVDEHKDGAKNWENLWEATKDWWLEWTLPFQWYTNPKQRAEWLT